MSLVKQLTTVSEFEKWLLYFDWRRENPDKSDWYSAATMQAILASQGVKTKVEDHLIRFKSTDAKKPKQDSKAIWLAMFGINPEAQ